MKYRNTDKSTLNSMVLGGIVASDMEDDSIMIQFENLTRPRGGWYYQNIVINSKPTDNDSRIRVTLPHGVKALLFGSLVTVHGVLVVDSNEKPFIMAETVEDLTANYSKPLKED